MQIEVEIHSEDHEHLKRLFHTFKAKHRKSYRNTRHHDQKFEIFKKHAKKVSDHNKDYKSGKVSWHMALNQFSDQVI